MQIRKVNPTDKQELTKLLLEFDAVSEKILSPKQVAFRAYSNLQKTVEDVVQKYVSQPEYIIFVAEDNSLLKGYISGKIIDKEYRLYNKEGYVEGWFVEENFQHQGTGKALFEALVEEFKKAECTHIGLDTNIENEEAIKIYEHMGFNKKLVTFFKTLKELS